MSQSTALDTLHDLAEKEVENAAVRLGEMRKGFQQAEEQLNMLINYQFEYSANLNDSMSQGIASTRWQNYQQFIQTLEKAIDQHRQQLNAWTNKVNQALNFWQEKQKRLQAWQTLRERKAAETLLAENRLDQKQMDEYAQRATLRKGE
ncbi:flagella biosynthesis chaperone FliJ [Enterobacteriaceae bacterium H18W14]|uniref:flagellar export protein FliJ n=1 Tax=Dryocola boscaweniae TaxID=2925397 RepID=UPI0022F0C171|nr:flagellar export protein FliJ [Dryocola boscaweniae]MCT4714438.1 flagella biosynthesis chaperone FliJ [Dryocola boscaweniae]